MPYVYSTLANSQNYTTYEKGGADLPVKVSHVEIKGGAGVATKHLQTPDGIVTKVTDAQLEELKINPTFQLHQKNGYIKVDTKQTDVVKAVSTMKAKDVSAPKTAADYKKDDSKDVLQPQPVVNASK